jgi:hypothetical protein
MARAKKKSKICAKRIKIFPDMPQKHRMEPWGSFVVMCLAIVLLPQAHAQASHQPKPKSEFMLISKQLKLRGVSYAPSSFLSTKSRPAAQRVKDG